MAQVQIDLQTAQEIRNLRYSIESLKNTIGWSAFWICVSIGVFTK